MESHFDDPEPPNPQDHTKDINKDEWKRSQRNSEFIGLLFAGRSEYNWIADIRIRDVSQEMWAIGNIVSDKHVLTTCKAVTTFEPKKNTDVEILYCTLWLFEEFKHFNLQKQVAFDIKSAENAGEARYATGYIKYSSCRKTSLDYDAGIIIMNKPVPTYKPFVGYMPVARDGTGQVVYSIDFSDMLEKRTICYVASYGRNYVDRQNHLVLDSKVKLRVYYEPWDFCKANFPMICTDAACPGHTTRFKVMCFSVRATVGSICDHDRGAPLVCDGQVYGFVVRGAAWDYCNTVWHLPIMVLKINHLTEFHQYFQKTPSDPHLRSIHHNETVPRSTAVRDSKWLTTIIASTTISLFT